MSCHMKLNLCNNCCIDELQPKYRGHCLLLLSTLNALTEGEERKDVSLSQGFAALSLSRDVDRMCNNVFTAKRLNFSDRAPKNSSELDFAT